MSMATTVAAAFMMYFAAGILREVICVAYYRAVSGKRAIPASGFAGGLELFDFLVLAAIFRSGWNIGLMLAYTLGVVIGTYGATKLSK